MICLDVICESLIQAEDGGMWCVDRYRWKGNQHEDDVGTELKVMTVWEGLIFPLS